MYHQKFFKIIDGKPRTDLHVANKSINDNIVLITPTPHFNQDGFNTMNDSDN